MQRHGHMAAFSGKLPRCTAHIEVPTNKGEKNRVLGKEREVFWKHDRNSVCVGGGRLKEERRGGREEGTRESTHLPMKAIGLGPGDIHIKPGSIFARNWSLDQLLNFSEFGFLLPWVGITCPSPLISSDCYKNPIKEWLRKHLVSWKCDTQTRPSVSLPQQGLF